MGVTAGLMQGWTGAFTERMQGRHLWSAFGNSVSMPIAALGLSGHCNGYRATVAVICNNIYGHKGLVTEIKLEIKKNKNGK